MKIIIVQLKTITLLSKIHFITFYIMNIKLQFYERTFFLYTDKSPYIETYELTR